MRENEERELLIGGDQIVVSLFQYYNLEAVSLLSLYKTRTRTELRQLECLGGSTLCLHLTV